MKKYIDFPEISSKNFIYLTFGIILSIIFIFVLIYVSRYVHEFGHASVAILSAFSQKSLNLTISFHYANFLGINGLKVPQQTKANILTSFNLFFNIAGVLATTFFYLIIFFLLDKIKIIRNNKFLEFTLAFSFLFLIIKSIALNLFCGTDGLKLSCSKLSIGILALVFIFLSILFLTLFFVKLTDILKNNQKNDASPRLESRGLMTLISSRT